MIFAQLATTHNDGVVLVQPGAGVGVKITPWRLRCGAARSCGLQFAVAVLVAVY